MILKTGFLLILQFLPIEMWLASSLYTYKQELPNSLQRINCKQHDLFVNDCNMCRCIRSRFMCEARNCDYVDGFGHFKDAIQSLDLGMEGKGVWRSRDEKQICQAGVHYTRDQLLCVCSKNGTWPNPVCRDIFRILHEVEIAETNDLTNKQDCQATKLYLVGCNVCFCPSTGKLDSKLCTNKTCTDDDPAIRTSNKTIENEVKDNSSLDQIQDLYAECQPDVKYMIGCRTCICLRNNRLLCGRCNETTNNSTKVETLCSNKTVGENFNVECNVCQCDKNEMIFCTTKRCVTGNQRRVLQRELDDISNYKVLKAEAPFDNLICEPGTTYKKGCNTCSCVKSGNSLKIFVCTLNACKDSNDSLSNLEHDCVPGTVYKRNCLICHCDVMNNQKREWCRVDHHCANKPSLGTGQGENKDLAKLNGYCEPLHLYNSKCNRCRCLPNGKMVMCTSRVCNQKKIPKPVKIDVVPLRQQNNICPQGQSYKVDCNYCYCLSNGNAMCTSLSC